MQIKPKPTNKTKASKQKTTKEIVFCSQKLLRGSITDVNNMVIPKKVANGVAWGPVSHGVAPEFLSDTRSLV